MALGKNLYLTKRNRSVVEVWNLDRKKRLSLIDVYKKAA